MNRDHCSRVAILFLIVSHRVVGKKLFEYLLSAVEGDENSGKSFRKIEPILSAWCLIRQGGELNGRRFCIDEDEANPEKRRRRAAFENKDACAELLFAGLSRLWKAPGNRHRISRPQTALPALRGQIHRHRSLKLRLRRERYFERIAPPRRSIARTLCAKTSFAGSGMISKSKSRLTFARCRQRLKARTRFFRLPVPDFPGLLFEHRLIHAKSESPLGPCSISTMPEWPKGTEIDSFITRALVLKS